MRRSRRCSCGFGGPAREATRFRCGCERIYGEQCEVRGQPVVWLSYLPADKIETARAVGTDRGMRVETLCYEDCAEAIMIDWPELSPRIAPRGLD